MTKQATNDLIRSIQKQMTLSKKFGPVTVRVKPDVKRDRKNASMAVGIDFTYAQVYVEHDLGAKCEGVCIARFESAADRVEDAQRVANDCVVFKGVVEDNEIADFIIESYKSIFSFDNNDK